MNVNAITINDCLEMIDMKGQYTSIHNGKVVGFIDEKMKMEVEQLLGCHITDEQYIEAFKYAKDKQEYIYKQERRAAVVQRWYLVKLIEEYVRSLAFSKLTMDLCQKRSDMEKEHLTNVKALPKQPYCSIS